MGDAAILRRSDGASNLPNSQVQPDIENGRKDRAAGKSRLERVREFLKLDKKSNRKLTGKLTAPATGKPVNKVGQS